MLSAFFPNLQNEWNKDMPYSRNGFSRFLVHIENYRQRLGKFCETLAAVVKSDYLDFEKLDFTSL